MHTFGEKLINIYYLSRYCREFEYQVKKNIDEKNIKCPVYLSVGTEHIPTIILQATEGTAWNIFAQHRCHSWYLAAGGDPASLAYELLGNPLGYCGGMAGSASIQWHGFHSLWGHSGLLGDQAPIAAGFAHSTQKPTILVIGDAAAEEDYVLGALGYIATHQLPVIIVCEDNDLSILTKTEVRRSWRTEKVAESMGIKTYNITDEPALLFNTLKEITHDKFFPAYINIRCIRHLWHAGTGQDEEPAYDRLKEMRDELKIKDDTIELNQTKEISTIWQNCLKQSAS